MSRRLDEFGPTTDVILITFTNQDRLTKYRETNQLSYPILTDTDRSVYRAFGLERGRLFRVWGWRAFKRYWPIIRESGFSRFESSDEDTLQLGGNFVIDPDRNMVWGFWGQGPDERPSVDTLISVVTSSRRQG